MTYNLDDLKAAYEAYRVYSSDPEAADERDWPEREAMADAIWLALAVRDGTMAAQAAARALLAMGANDGAR